MSRLSDHAAAFGFGRDRAGDAARREDMASRTITADEWRAIRSGSDLTPDPEPVDGHQLTRKQNATATLVFCECGRWDGGWTGPASRSRVLADYRAHVTAEQAAAAGPIKVRSERADQPRELP